MGADARALRGFLCTLGVQGHEKSVELYTQAVSACKLRGAVDLDTALKIYAHMQLNQIQPDKKFFAALIATAGAAGRLDLAFEMLTDVQAEGVVPGSTVCSGLILACIKDRRFHLAQKVYNLCADKVSTRRHLAPGHSAGTHGSVTTSQQGKRAPALAAAAHARMCVSPWCVCICGVSPWCVCICRMCVSPWCVCICGVPMRACVCPLGVSVSVHRGLV